MAHLGFLHFAYASMVLEWQLDIVYAAVLDFSHLLLIATTVFVLQHIGLLHNAVHSSSIVKYITLKYHHILQLALSLLPHSARCSIGSAVFVPVTGWKNTTSASCSRWYYHMCKWSACASNWRKNAIIATSHQPSTSHADCSLPHFLCWTTIVCTGGGYIGSQSSQQPSVCHTNEPQKGQNNCMWLFRQGAKARTSISTSRNRIQ